MGGSPWLHSRRTLPWQSGPGTTVISARRSTRCPGSAGARTQASASAGRARTSPASPSRCTPITPLAMTPRLRERLRARKLSAVTITVHGQFSGSTWRSGSSGGSWSPSALPRSACPSTVLRACSPLARPRRNGSSAPPRRIFPSDSVPWEGVGLSRVVRFRQVAGGSSRVIGFVGLRHGGQFR